MAEKDKIYPFSKMQSDEKEEQVVMEDVYAGPEFFENRSAPDTPGEDAEVPPDDSDEKKEEPVIRGYNGMIDQSQMMMMVYAGPQYFEEKRKAQVIFAPDCKPDFVQCPYCGSCVSPDCKFCTECGKE